LKIWSLFGLFVPISEFGLFSITYGQNCPFYFWDLATLVTHPQSVLCLECLNFVTSLLLSPSLQNG
jgi:hypothetical protein